MSLANYEFVFFHNNEMINYTWKTSTTLCLTRKFDREVSSALPIRSKIDIDTSSNSSLIIVSSLLLSVSDRRMDLVILA